MLAKYDQLITISLINDIHRINTNLRERVNETKMYLLNIKRSINKKLYHVYLNHTVHTNKILLISVILKTK